jgi:predicted Fe-Mo cluster-binding NifX family protein
MKIAFVTDDGERICAHFGRATHYLVVSVEDGKEIARELREKMGHAHFGGEHHHEDHSGAPHGFDPQSQSRHASMLAVIEDCSVVIGGGMGQGALMSIQASGKEVRLTDISDINQALSLFLAGNLPNLQNLAH